MFPVAHAISVKRRRLAFKGPPPAAYAAFRTECFSEADLAALRLDARRFHIHYTHIRTTDSSHVQPEHMTREEFWKHLVKVYREALIFSHGFSSSFRGFGPSLAQMVLGMQCRAV